MSKFWFCLLKDFSAVKTYIMACSVLGFCRNESPTPYGNIMYDRRIVRGNTYAQRTLPAVSFKWENSCYSFPGRVMLG